MCSFLPHIRQDTNWYDTFKITYRQPQISKVISCAYVKKNLKCRTNCKIIALRNSRSVLGNDVVPSTNWASKKIRNPRITFVISVRMFIHMYLFD